MQRGQGEEGRLLREGHAGVRALQPARRTASASSWCAWGRSSPSSSRTRRAVASATKRRTGDVLVERGLLKDTERLYYVGQQVKAIIYSLFGWEEGTYVMTFKEQGDAPSPSSSTSPGQPHRPRRQEALQARAAAAASLRPEDRLIPVAAAGLPAERGRAGEVGGGAAAAGRRHPHRGRAARATPAGPSTWCSSP